MTIAIRHAPDAGRNRHLRNMPAQDGETNLAWLQRVRAGSSAQGRLLLLGGVSVPHFRIRVAQSQLRADLMPSFWSQVGIMLDDETFASVPLGLHEANFDVPSNNGVQTCQLSDYADPANFPNIALINFTESFEPISQNIERIKNQRSVVDLPHLMLPWLGYIWGAGQAVNPLIGGTGLPSAVFAETTYGLAGIELTPGLATSASCPEAIWSTALWWQEFYEGITAAEERAETDEDAPAEDNEAAAETPQAASFVRARAMVPTGASAIRQPAAAVRG